AAGLTRMLAEVALVRPVLEKLRLMGLATLCERLAKVATPLTAVAVRVPCKVPLPALRAAVTTVVLSLLRRLPKGSWMAMAGCWAKGTPAVAVLEGWVTMTSELAAAGVTVKMPLAKVNE